VIEFGLPHDRRLQIQKALVGGRVKEIARAKLSTYAEALLYHRGKPLDLSRHLFTLPLYNSTKKRLLLKCARQVSKSTSIANILITRCCLTPSLRVLYVSPSAQQTRQFSNEKLRPTLKDSPLIAKYFFNEHTCINQTYEKTFLNGSHMFLRYAFLTPDRARGIPCEVLALDEIQDILKNNVRVISESLSAADIVADTNLDQAGTVGVEIQAGTPKTFDNTIEDSWKLSTQNEWYVRCERHSPVHMVDLDDRAIGKAGPICDKCGGPINPLDGMWVRHNPDGEYWGFRISQLMVPWKLREDRWKEQIVWKMENWPEAQFHNEVLGLSYDNAAKPINTADVQRCCFPVAQIQGLNSSRFIDGPTTETRKYQLFGGVDWGEGREEGSIEHGKKTRASFTVLTIGAYVTENLFWTVYQKRYTGREIDPEFVKEDILRLVNLFGVELLGVDWGHGWGVNSWLFQQLGKHKVVQFYHSDNLAERKKWDPGGWKFIVNRNSVISSLLNDIKEGKFLFPVWEQFKEFADDILGVYVDYHSRNKKMYYEHSLDQPDDAMHSLLYARLAADTHLGRF